MLLLLCLPLACSLHFAFVLQKRELRCFGDNLASNQLVVGTVQGNSTEYSVKVLVAASLTTLSLEPFSAE